MKLVRPSTVPTLSYRTAWRRTYHHPGHRAPLISTATLSNEKKSTKTSPVTARIGSKRLLASPRRKERERANRAASSGASGMARARPPGHWVKSAAAWGSSPLSLARAHGRAIFRGALFLDPPPPPSRPLFPPPPAPHLDSALVLSRKCARLGVSLRRER